MNTGLVLRIRRHAAGCVTVEGWQIRVGEPPSEEARVISFSPSRNGPAASSPRRRNLSMNPGSDCWRRAISWPEAWGEPGKMDRLHLPPGAEALPQLWLIFTGSRLHISCCDAQAAEVVDSRTPR